MSTAKTDPITGAQEPEQEVPQPPIIVLTPSRDGMELQMLLQRSTAETLKPVYGDVVAAIAAQGVVYGINETAITALCDNPVYNRPLAVARGTPAKKGKDGYLNYLVETTRELRPKHREDGTVDYRDIGFVQIVAKEQPLCEIHKAEKGEDGCDIYGKVLEGLFGREAANPQGKNTDFNEDGTLLLATVDGDAVVTKGVVNVVDVLRISGNVDNSTGDIQFVGDIIIAGDVISGFRVSSQGSVTVKGSVEGATIQATGDIFVGQGINGMGRGSVIAGGSLKCKYIQSCYIEANQNIYADSIMYCNMECGGNVELGGKRAALIGGRSSIAGFLTTKTIGTDSHVNTQITMASSGTKKNKEILDLAAQLKAIDADCVKLVQLMARYDDLLKQNRLDQEQTKNVLTVKETYMAQVQRRAEVSEQLEQVKQEQLEASKASSYIICKGRTHVGVQITFGPISMTVQNSFVNSRISIVNEDIAIMAL